MNTLVLAVILLSLPLLTLYTVLPAAFGDEEESNRRIEYSAYYFGAELLIRLIVGIYLVFKVLLSGGL